MLEIGNICSTLKLLDEFSGQAYNLLPRRSAASAIMCLFLNLMRCMEIFSRERFRHRFFGTSLDEVIKCLEAMEILSVPVHSWRMHGMALFAIWVFNDQQAVGEISNSVGLVNV
ncbi:hypothetical protein QYF36_021564 [Acer negundo]|nr:hypothetical protein QYF36_021564 [Acer negundo]